MEKVILKELLQRSGIWLKNRLWERLKGVFIRAWDSIKEKLWNEIREEVRASARELIADAEIFLTSVEALEKEKLIIDILMSRIELPFVLKPFKGLMRKILKSKIEETVQGLLQKGKEFVG